jgi:bifunctional non-homologous end joining protein LigD
VALTDYQRKRHFKKTPEPAGKVARRTGWSYVVQKHAASRLHYDFRLELDGVLKSWAVPKGPCLDPTVKRLAVQVEDHPVDYGGFEGTIPQGQYGGGTVMLWDTGTWEPVGDPNDGYRTGKLKFQLHGEKLRGGWMLVRSRSRPGASSPEWLLFKERDDEAQPLADGDILEQSPLSVVSDRDLDTIAAAKDRVWSSDRSTDEPATSNGAKARPRKTAPAAASAKMKPATAPRKSSALAAASTGKKEKLPDSLEPQLATLTKDAPAGDEWLHEVKFDGYRMLCRIEGKSVAFISRNQLDWTDRLAPLVEAAGSLPVQSALLDGEVVALSPDGTTDFQALQNAFRDGKVQNLHYYAFDLLHLDGHPLQGLPLENRKQTLEELLREIDPQGSIRYSDHIDGRGRDFAKQACVRQLEGIISKRRDRPYQPGRGYDWLKVKCVKEEEFVIGGYTDPSGSRQGFGALLLGYYDSEGRLQYVGKVGTGFDDRTLTSLHKRLKPLRRERAPFADPKQLTAVRQSHWVEPTLVAQIVYGSRTREGILRHASFLGLREDKPAEEVTLDKPLPVTEAVAMSKSQKAPQTPNSSARGGDSKSKQPAKRGGRVGRPERNGGGVRRPAPNAGGGGVRRPAPNAPKPAPNSLYDSTKEEFAGVRLTSPDKVLYPDVGFTKLGLAEYYHDIAEWILPHIQHRPLVLVRCPDGQAGQCFYQKHPGAGTPAELRQLPIREKTKTEPYVLVDNREGLIALAQVGALEIHAWGSREDLLEKPDRLIFDLDPDPEVPWKRVVDSARQIRDFLQELGLQSFVKTTGGKGLHLVVPIDRRHEWDDAKAFCKRVADTIVSIAPHQYTANMSKAARGGKIFVDYLRNGRGATAIVPYSTRTHPGAPVSTPLTWKELTPRITSDHFTVQNIRQRLASLKADPWEGIDKVRQSLAGPIRQLGAVLK